jgi:L-fucose isomerase-like protein
MLNEKITAGFVGFGEVNTPKEIIERKCKESIDLLSSLGIVVKSTDPVSDDPEGSQAERAAEELKKMEFDFLIVCIAGWIPTWAVIKTIESFKHRPVLLWGLSGDKMKDRFITTAAQAGTTALRKTMEDMGFRFKYVVNRMEEEISREQITSFAMAAHASTRLHSATIGMAGCRDMRLYGTLYDASSLKGKIGIEVEHFDLLEISRYMGEVSQKEIGPCIRHILKNWKFIRQPHQDTIYKTVKLYLAFKKKISERSYDAISYSDVDGVKKLFGFSPAGALTLLHDKNKISSIPENDSMGAVTQLITSFLTGNPAAYLEFYEFTQTGALMGVPDYIPGGIVEGKVTILPTSFGGFGEGFLNVSKLKTGQVTLARLANNGSDYFLHLINGTAKIPLRWEEAGWAPPAPQLPSLEIDFDGDTEQFIQTVLSQHYIISYGNQLQLYKDFCSIHNIRII